MFLLPLLVLFQLAPSDPNDLSKWPVYSEPHGTFSIRLPAAPTVDSSPDGTTYRIMVEDSLYYVSVVPIPPGQASTKPSDLLTTFRDTLLRIFNQAAPSRLISSNAATYLDHPSLTFGAESTSPEGKVFRQEGTLLYLGSAVLYVGYGARTDHFVAGRARALLSSLSLGASVPAPTAAEAKPAAAPAEVLRQAESVLREGRPQEALDLARQVAASSEAEAARQAHILICQARAALPEPPFGGPSKETQDDLKSVGRDPVTPPSILHRTGPHYTEEARKNRIEGKVVLGSILDEEGCVTRVEVLRSLDPGLDAVAVDTVRHWVFRPAMFHDKPIKVYYSLTINFAIEKQAPPKASPPG